VRPLESYRAIVRSAPTRTLLDHHHLNGANADTFLMIELPVYSRLDSGGLVSSKVVMPRLGYRNRASFWEFVRRHGVPHIRFNARRIMFEPNALNNWLSRRSSNGVVNVQFTCPGSAA
jgi:hypothetical protein